MTWDPDWLQSFLARLLTTTALCGLFSLSVHAQSDPPARVESLSQIQTSPGASGNQPMPAARPSYRGSVAYLRNVNRFIVGTNIPSGTYFFQGRPEATTVARLDDLIHGRPVHGHGREVNPARLARALVIVPPALIERGR